ncbi:lipopolysaccharide biosynthesis protein [Acidobacteria bacterium AH-259-O06]|nr:lipopolysaccharide biosynthesis protein [Acidobacteria bacterium AH-259-O06]
MDTGIKDRELSSDGSLTRAVVSGGSWTTLNDLATKGLGAIKIVILARLLSSEDFGLMGLALVVVGTVNRFSYPGIYTALIQKQSLESRDLNAGWWIHAVRGFFLFLLLFPVSGWAAEFYEEPRLKIILQVVSIGFLLDGVQSIGLVRINRELDFRRLTWLHQTANLVSLTVAVILAWLLQNVWALVAAHIAQLLVLALVSYIVEPFWPNFRLDWNCARKLVHFGRYIFAAAIASYLIVRGNEFVLGKVVGLEVYGYYAVAFSMVAIVATPIEVLITSVSFPAMSRIRGDFSRLERGFLRIFRSAVMASVPLFLGLALFGKDVVALLLGPKWLPVLVPLVGLCFFEWFHCLTLTLQSLHNAVGLVGLQAKLRFIQLIVYCLGILPIVIHWGTAGAAWWLFVVAALAFLVQLYTTNRHVKGVFWNTGQVLVSYWPLYLLQGFFALLQWQSPTTWLRFLGLGAVYGLCVVIFLYWKEKELLLDLLHNLKPSAVRQNLGT